MLTAKEVREKCWRVKHPTINLPEGFELWEDMIYVYLLHGETVVVVFNASTVMPGSIIQAIYEYLQANCR